MDEQWRERAACIGQHELFIPARRSNGQKIAARSICGNCPVQEDCLEYALATHQQGGVWGGLSTKERLALQRDRLAQEQLEAA